MLRRIFDFVRKPRSPFEEINLELEKIGSCLKVSDKRVSLRNRHCIVFGNYIDFWENGMKWLGVDKVADPAIKAKLLHLWLERGTNSDEIEEAVPGIEFPISRKKIEEGEESYLNWYWQNLRARGDRRFGRLIDLFAANDRTRRLMSFVRTRDFAFSNRIPPHDVGPVLPFVRITDNWDYEVVVSFGILDEDADQLPRRVVGKGNADEAYEMILNYLPSNLGMARYQWCQEDAA